MNNHEQVPAGQAGGNNEALDVVERGARAMRDLATPEMPGDLMERTIAATRAAEGSGGVGPARAESTMGSKKKGWWRMKVVRRTAVAAGLAIVVGAGVTVGTWGGGRAAFADVVQQVKAAKEVACKLTMAVKSAETLPQPVARIPMEMRMADDGWINMTVSVKAGVGIRMVTDGSGKMMMIDDAHKQVMIFNLKKQPVAPGSAPNLLTEFSQMTGQGKPLGEKEIAGQKTRGFEVDKGEKQWDVWADETTDKPVLVELTVTNRMMPTLHMTFSDFDWNPSGSAMVKGFAAPAGYTVANLAMNAAPATEADVTGMLAAESRMNGGVLPAKVDVSSVVTGMSEAQHANGAATMVQSEEATMARIMPLARGWAFMGAVKNGTDWTYGGAGAKWGEKGKAVLWYKPVGEGWRVFDADGTVHAATAEPSGGTLVEMHPLAPSDDTGK